jgi:predicted acetyltransferase
VTQRPEFGPPLDEREALEAAETVSRAFGRAPWVSPDYFERVGRENQRVLREKGRAVATLAILPLGQFFGGRPVPMAGIAAVAVAPERWGERFGAKLMCETVRELSGSGVALSTLYPATHTLYRRAGYETAGGHYEVALTAREIGLAERELALRPMEERDRGEVARLYREHAERTPGHLDRSPFIWGRVRHVPGRAVDGYVVEVEGRVEGYAYLAPQVRPDFRLDVDLTDIVARSPRAGRRLLTFLADHRTQVEEVRWRGSPSDPLFPLLPERGYRVRLLEHWMLRIANVEAALSRRGYPEAVQAELHFAVRDDVAPENDGRFVLEVSGGEGRVKTGGAGRIEVDVRGLAPLYSAHLSPFALERAGLLRAPERDLAAAAAVFAGPPPWMTDRF